MPTTYLIKKFPESSIGTGGIDTGVAAATVAGPFNMLDARPPLLRAEGSGQV
jgi:hypothetical protein